jgi:SagB-type dehydrogenase family enzyme
MMVNLDKVAASHQPNDSGIHVKSPEFDILHRKPSTERPMSNAHKIFAVFAALVIAASVILYFEREKIMRSNIAPVSGQPPIPLPRPALESTTSIEKALKHRRSTREFLEVPLSLEEVAQLLWAAQGITHEKVLRTAPSAGALYPLETYVVAGNVTNLPAGMYRYLPYRHELALVLAGDLRGQLCEAALSQSSVRRAPASIVLSAVFARATGKYGKRGIRYGQMEAGTAAQNASLQAVSLNLGTVVIGAFDDGEVHRVLSLPGNEDPMIIMPVGKMRDASSVR